MKSVPPDRIQPQATMVATANENIIQLTENLESVHKDVQGNEYALKMLLVRLQPLPNCQLFVQNQAVQFEFAAR